MGETAPTGGGGGGGGGGAKTVSRKKRGELEVGRPGNVGARLKAREKKAHGMSIQTRWRTIDPAPRPSNSHRWEGNQSD